MLVGQVLRSPLPHAPSARSTLPRPKCCPGSRPWSRATTSRTCPRSSSRPARCWSTTATWCATSWRARRCCTRAAVAAVAATSAKIAKEALKLIEVEYEPLPVIDVVEAMEGDAPLLHEDMFTAGVEPRPKPALERRQAGRVRARRHCGRLRPGGDHHRAHLRHQARAPGLHRAARLHRQLLRGRPGGAVVRTQGHFIVRGHCAKMLGMDVSKLRVTASRSAAASAARPWSISSRSLALSRKAHHPVKMVMSREEVFRATGPTSGANVWVKVGVTKRGSPPPRRCSSTRRARSRAAPCSRAR